MSKKSKQDDNNIEEVNLDELNFEEEIEIEDEFKEPKEEDIWELEDEEFEEFDINEE
jgi:hypothetical protein